jgi:multicomponent Na+:H+ antiporter subunit B
MSRRVRLSLFLLSGAGLAVLLGFALAGLPGFDAPLGDYARVVAGSAVQERAATNTVVTVAFDYRALDTLGEEFMIFVAAVGTAVLLRATRGESADERVAEHEETRAPATSDALRALGGALVPPAVVLGVYVVTHGHLTPGGGFQGGVVLAAGILLVYVAGRHVAMRRAHPPSVLEVSEAAGAAGFALVGVGGLMFAGTFLENFIDTGTQGRLLSGGTIPLSNVAVGVEVAGAFMLVIAELLEQVVLRRGRPQ